MMVDNALNATYYSLQKWHPTTPMIFARWDCESSSQKGR
jgi:hypothetical protein